MPDRGGGGDKLQAGYTVACGRRGSTQLLQPPEPKSSCWEVCERSPGPPCPGEKTGPKMVAAQQWVTPPLPPPYTLMQRSALLPNVPACRPSPTSLRHTSSSLREGPPSACECSQDPSALTLGAGSRGHLDELRIPRDPTLPPSRPTAASTLNFYHLPPPFRSSPRNSSSFRSPFPSS